MHSFSEHENSNLICMLVFMWRNAFCRFAIFLTAMKYQPRHTAHSSRDIFVFHFFLIFFFVHFGVSGPYAIHRLHKWLVVQVEMNVDCRYNSRPTCINMHYAMSKKPILEMLKWRRHIHTSSIISSQYFQHLFLAFHSSWLTFFLSLHDLK